MKEREEDLHHLLVWPLVTYVPTSRELYIYFIGWNKYILSLLAVHVYGVHIPGNRWGEFAETHPGLISMETSPARHQNETGLPLTPTLQHLPYSLTHSLDLFSFSPFSHSLILSLVHLLIRSFAHSLSQFLAFRALVRRSIDTLLGREKNVSLRGSTHSCAFSSTPTATPCSSFTSSIHWKRFRSVDRTVCTVTQLVLSLHYI